MSVCVCVRACVCTWKLWAFSSIRFRSIGFLTTCVCVCVFVCVEGEGE